MALYSNQSIPENIDPTPSNSSAINNIQVLNSGVAVLQVNPLRKGYTLFNNSDHPVYVGNSDSVNTTDNFFLKIPAGGFYESEAASVYTGAIWAISTDESFILAHEFGILPT